MKDMLAYIFKKRGKPEQSMKAMKYAFGVIVLLLMAGLLFAQTPSFPQQNLAGSEVHITPANQDGSLINISLIVYTPAVTTNATISQDTVRQWAIQCNYNQTCIDQLSLNATSSLRNYQMNMSSLAGAQFVVMYFNPQGNIYAGQWTPVLDCSPYVTATTPVTAYAPDVNGNNVPYTQWTAQCDLTNAIQGRNRTSIKVTFIPQPGQNVSSSSATMEVSNANVTASTAFTQQIRDFVNAVSNSGGAGLGGGTLPCVGVFLILGLLLASLYFSGKSPVSMLDITTPRLPTPKGVSASGQILLPWGYGEMKKTANDKMQAAVGAINAGTRVMAGQNPDAARLMQQAGSIRGGADSAADRQVAGSIAVLGRTLGFSSASLQPLVTRLPYHYGDAEHKVVADILEAARKKGGREALNAAMIQDYLYGQSMLKHLDTLSGHPDFAQKGAVQARVEKFAGKFIGANRYAVVGAGAMAGVGSMFRVARQGRRMTGAIVTEAPTLARATARTTMEMLGGKNIVEELEARGRTSSTAAWMAGQLQKHPSEVVVGAMYPVNDKMAKLYRDLRDEAHKDAMEYVIKQGYKAMGLKFGITQEELVEMSYKDVDLLKRIGYRSSAEMSAFEEEVRRVLSNSSMSSADKLSALSRVAESHGASVDHQMVNFMRRLDTIDATGQPEHVKMLLLDQALEEQSRVRMSTSTGGMAVDDRYVCHVGGQSLKGTEVADKMLLGTLVWDGTHGYLRGGLKEEALSMQNNMINRGLGIIDHTKPESVENALALLPEFMRNRNEVVALSERAKGNFVQMLDTPECRKLFEEYSAAKGGRKSLEQASISEIVDFMYGGKTPKTGTIDPKSGRKVWWTADEELGLPQGAAMVDVKRAWDVDINTRKMHQLGPWLEARFSRGNVSAYDAGVEAQVKRLPGYASMSVEQESAAAKKIWFHNEMLKDLEDRFNGQFAHNAYGTTRETMKFYTSIMAGFLERAIEEKKGHAYQQELQFLDKMDVTSPKDMGKFRGLLQRYESEYQAIISKPMTYDEIARSNKPVILFQEGGYGYWRKGQTVSDMDRVMAGQAALRDEKGQLRPFIPEDVPVHFGNRDDLTALYHKVRNSRETTPDSDWHTLANAATKWAKEGGYSYERERVLGALLWEYGSKTHDYESFWRNSAVTIEAKRNVAPVAPSVLRMFGVEAPGLMTKFEPLRNLGMAAGDYISKIAYATAEGGGKKGGTLTASYTGAAVAAAYSAHSFDLSRRIMAGEGLESLTEQEAAAFRKYASMHGAFTQARQWTFDRSPFGYSTSHGTNAADAAMFAHGPGLTFKKEMYVGAVMDKYTYWNFNAMYGWPMDLTRRMMAPYATAVSAAQKEMVGRAGRWDTTGDQYRMLYHTEPRVRSAMQSFFNPLSLSNSKLARRLNVWQSSAAHHQVGGEEVMLGLSAMTQDVRQYRKGILVNARYGDVNPRETLYDPRVVKHLDAPMAYELLKDPAFKYQRQIQDDAHAMTVRRTAAAETLAITRGREMMSFNSLQTPQGKFYSPIHFAASILGVPNMISKHVAQTKYGYSSGSLGQRLEAGVKNKAEGLKNFVKPAKLPYQTRCGKCGHMNGRYDRCAACGASLW